MAQRLGADRVSTRPAPCRSRRERLDPPGRCGPMSSRSRSSASASTRPRIATSANAAAATPTRWRSGSRRSSPRAARCTTPRPTRAGSSWGRSQPSASFPTRRPSATGSSPWRSLTLTPLRLDEVTARRPRVRRRSRWPAPPTSATGPPGPRARRPAPGRRARALDVCAAASQTRDLAPAAGRVCVLGAGHAGKLALAAARDASTAATSSRSTSTRPPSIASRALGLCDIGVATDLRDPLGGARAVRAAGGRPGRPDGRRRQRHRLRAGRDPADRRRGHGPVLLDGDELRDRRAGRRRDLLRGADGGRQRLLARPRRLRARPGSRRSEPLREALGLRVEEPA